MSFHVCLNNDSVHPRVNMGILVYVAQPRCLSHLGAWSPSAMSVCVSHSKIRPHSHVQLVAAAEGLKRANKLNSDSNKVFVSFHCHRRHVDLSIHPHGQKGSQSI